MDTDNPVVCQLVNVFDFVASVDVIHNWSMAPFGVKIDTVPGRLNETWVQIDKAGTYYGFCSELCGVNHAYMPIMVKAVRRCRVRSLGQECKKEFARVDEPERLALPAVKVAQNGTTK